MNKENLKKLFSSPSTTVPAVIIFIWFIFYYLLPPFAEIFKELGCNLPLCTSIVIAVSDYIVEGGIVLLTVIVAVPMILKELVFRKKEDLFARCMCIFIGVVIGFIVISLFLPLFLIKK